jgi:hypothetical protein
VLDVLFGGLKGSSVALGALGVLYEGLGISKLKFLIKKIYTFFSAVIFFQFLDMKALDPD